MSQTKGRDRTPHLPAATTRHLRRPGTQRASKMPAGHCLSILHSALPFALMRMPKVSLKTMTAWKDRFSESTLNLLRLLGQHTTYKLLQRAHPEISEEQIRDMEVEVAKALELKNASSRDAMLQTFEVAKELLKEENAHLPSPEGAYQLRISLMRSSPEIWRRFVVPGDISLETLHHVIQDVMGWEECHLHRFTIDGEDYAAADDGGIGGEIDAHDEREHHLHHLVKR